MAEKRSSMSKTQWRKVFKEANQTASLVVNSADCETLTENDVTKLIEQLNSLDPDILEVGVSENKWVKVARACVKIEARFPRFKNKVLSAFYNRPWYSRLRD